MSKELATNIAQTPFAGDAQSFDLAQRMATALSSSAIVPLVYQKNIPNTLVAMEYAHRVKMSVLAVMQNLHVIHGKPSPSASFIIAAINSCGRFRGLRFEMSGEGDEWGCVAWTQDKHGEILRSPRVTIAMAKAEGWIARTGSKWKTMPELMLQYRAAAFFGRLYAPEILMGMQTSEEREDIGAGDAIRETRAAAMPSVLKKQPIEHIVIDAEDAAEFVD